MKRQIRFWGTRSVCFLVAVLAGNALGATKITSIDFKANEAESVIELTGDGPLTIDKQENEADKQIVLEIKDSELVKGAERKLDTSSFNSPVSLISPYKVEGQESVSRVVIQLREMKTATVSQDGNKVRVTLAGTGSSDSGPPVDQVPGPEGETGAAASTSAPASAEAETASATPGSDSAESSAGPPLSPTEQQLQNFVEAKTTKRFQGKPITIQVRDAELVDVFRLIGEASGFNIVVADDVVGRVTLSLTNVPWDQVLDVILSTKQLGAERTANILRIVTLQGLTIEKNNEIVARRATEASAPRITRIFPISYANPAELATILRTMTMPRPLPGEPPAPAGTDTCLLYTSPSPRD